MSSPKLFHRGKIEHTDNIQPNARDDKIDPIDFRRKQVQTYCSIRHLTMIFSFYTVNNFEKESNLKASFTITQIARFADVTPIEANTWTFDKHLSP